MNLRGAYTALITPFRDGQVDVDALAALVERQIDGGIHGLVPCGTTGESATMSEDEQLLVIRTVVDAAAGRVPVVAGTGSNDTAKTVKYTQKVAAIDGVDAALVVVPYYNKPDQEGLFRHFTTVADEGGLPVVLYNVPGRTVRSFTPQTVGRLADHDNIIAIKEATGDMVFDTRIFEEVGRKIAVLSGDDFTTFPLLACGGAGCVSVLSNLDPRTMSRMCDAALDGDWETARQLHMKIQPLARALFSAPNPVPTKTIASMLGWCDAQVRGPLYDVDEEARASLEAIIADYGLQG
jgi:4-hydroxy-tetrahydrodipicolinate synthase